MLLNMQLLNSSLFKPQQNEAEIDHFHRMCEINVAIQYSFFFANR